MQANYNTLDLEIYNYGFSTKLLELFGRDAESYMKDLLRQNAKDFFSKHQRNLTMVCRMALVSEMLQTF